MLEKLKTLIKNFDWSLKSLVKIIMFIFGGTIVLAVVIAILGMALRFASFDSQFKVAQSHSSIPPMLGGMMNELGDMFDGGYGGEDSMLQKRGVGMMATIPRPYLDEGVSEEMEDYEKISYSASIERYKIEPVCDSVEALKPLDYVVFKNANRSDKYCSYRFSVESDREEEIADIVRELSPKSFDVSIDTREPAVSGNVFEIEILTERLDAIKESLAQAELAYNDAIALATSKGKIEGLAKLIDSKLNLIERLSNQKRNVAQQLARLSRSGERTISETEYAHFAVQISKKQIVDWESIASSWRYNLDNFVSSLNNTLQKLTFGLVSFALVVVQLLVYIFVALAFARLAWILARKVWKWNGR